MNYRHILITVTTHSGKQVVPMHSQVLPGDGRWLYHELKVRGRFLGHYRLHHRLSNFGGGLQGGGTRWGCG